MKNKSVVEKSEVAVIMGSDSDWPVVEETVQTLNQFGIRSEAHVISAHRTPDVMEEYAHTAKERGLKVIIAGAGGSAHLPGMTASSRSKTANAASVRPAASATQARNRRTRTRTDAVNGMR